MISIVATLLFDITVAANLNKGDKAPNFTLRTIDGKSFKLSDNLMRNTKAIVLNIWSTNCAPCKAEIPFLVDIDKTYNNKDVIVVGLTLDWNKDQVRSLIRDLNVTYTIAIDQGGKKIGADYKIESIPATYVIDQNGIIHSVHGGFPPKNKDAQKKTVAEIEKSIKELISEK